MVKVSAERTQDCQAVLEIRVEPEHLEPYLERAYRRLAQRTEVPGFRRGKAPRVMLERYLGRHRLLHEALDILVPEVVRQALDQEGIEPFDRPTVEVVQEEPPVIKATVPLAPVVELGDYRSLRLPRPQAEVDPSEVDAALEELRHRYALHEPVDRPVQWGDIVRLDIRVQADGRTLVSEEDVELRLREGTVLVLPGLADGILGMAKGEEKVFELPVPEDYPRREVAGRTARATVRVHEVKQERLPDLDDDFARQVGEGFPDLASLRRRLEDDIRQRKQQELESSYRLQAVDALVQAAERIEYPPVLLEQEVERLLRDEARAAGRDVDRYLEQLRRSPEEAWQELRPRAEERLRRSLALSKLAELEGIQVPDEEVQAEIDSIVAAGGPDAQQLRALLESPAGRDSIRRTLLTRKTIDRLVEIVSGEGAGAAAGAQEVEANDR
ncbi:MAG TPA: trigger factor [Dehalococcoidia bacterium]|nr:trigger factor [Dehalococcoidia bacterium]